GVAAMTIVVPPPVAEVDPTGEGDVPFRPGPMAEDDELLMMAATTSNAFVQEDLAARLLDHRPQVQVLLLAEVALVGVGPPHQPPDVDASPGELAEHAADLGARPRQRLVGVSTPIGEHDEVSRFQLLKALVEALEVVAAVHERPDRVPLRPGGVAGVAAVEVGVRVPSLVRREEPVIGPHLPMPSHPLLPPNPPGHEPWERYPERR